MRFWQCSAMILGASKYWQLATKSLHKWTNYNINPVEFFSILQEGQVTQGSVLRVQDNRIGMVVLCDKVWIAIGSRVKRTENRVKKINNWENSKIKIMLILTKFYWVDYFFSYWNKVKHLFYPNPDAQFCISSDKKNHFKKCSKDKLTILVQTKLFQYSFILCWEINGKGE